MVTGEPLPLLLTGEQARALLGASQHRFYRWVRTGHIPPDCVLVDPDTGRRAYRRIALERWATGGQAA